MIQKRSILFILPLYSALSFQSYAHSAAETNEEKSKAATPQLSIVQIGLGVAQFQDKATSPLIYSGLHINVGLGRTWAIKKVNELSYKINVGVTPANTNPPQQVLSASNFAWAFNGQLSLGYLHNITIKGNPKLVVKAGAKADTWVNFRINTNHMNNAIGYDIIANLMASGKVTYDISGKRRNRTLFTTVDVGILNFNNRPGYNYTSIIPLISDEYTKDDQLNRKWKMNGFRLQTEIGIISSKFKGYSQSYSYVFEGIKAPGRFEPFGFATHNIKYTLYLKRNK